MDSFVTNVQFVSVFMRIAKSMIERILLFE